MQATPGTDRTLLGQDVKLLGCPLRGRNMCELDPDSARIQEIGRGLQALTQAVGKPKALSSDTLVMCEGTDVRDPATGQRARFFVLLTEPVYMPIFQEYTWCKVLGPDLVAPRLRLPFDIEVDVAPVRLEIEADGQALGAHHLTSVELSKRMIGAAASWSLQVLKYDMLSALKMRVLGVDEVLESPISCQGGAHPRNAKAGAGQSARKDPDMQALLSLADLDADPLAPRPKPKTSAGRGQRRPQPKANATMPAAAAAAAAAIVEAPHRPARGLDEPDELEEWDAYDPHAGFEEEAAGWGAGGSMDADLLALGNGMLEEPSQLHRGGDDVDQQGEGELADLVRGGAGADVVQEGIGLAGEIGAEVLAVAEGGEDAEGLEHTALVFAGPSVPALPAEARMDVEGAPPGWSMTSLGYVYNKAHRQVGRITRWGNNISCRCSVNGNAHGSCSLAKGKDIATEGQMVQWLALGQERLALPYGPRPVDYQGARAGLKQAHTKLWLEIAPAPAR